MESCNIVIVWYFITRPEPTQWIAYRACSCHGMEWSSLEYCSFKEKNTSSGLNPCTTRSPIPAFMTSSCRKPYAVFTTSPSKLTTSCAQSCIVWVKEFSDTDRSTGHVSQLRRRANALSDHNHDWILVVGWTPQQSAVQNTSACRSSEDILPRVYRTVQ